MEGGAFENLYILYYFLIEVRRFSKYYSGERCDRHDWRICPCQIRHYRFAGEEQANFLFFYLSMLNFVLSPQIILFEKLKIQVASFSKSEKSLFFQVGVKCELQSVEDSAAVQDRIRFSVDCSANATPQFEGILNFFEDSFPFFFSGSKFF